MSQDLNNNTDAVLYIDMMHVFLLEHSLVDLFSSYTDAATDGAPVMDNSSPYTGRVKLATSRLSQTNLEDGQVLTLSATTTNDTTTDSRTGITQSESTFSNPTSCT